MRPLHRILGTFGGVRPFALAVLAGMAFGGVAIAAPPSGGPAVPDDGLPRTCLVLSGGGARGAAHIGVLKVLEELRVPVHCIAGTSMGSIVGGLYASGLSPSALDETIRSIDWVDAFNDAPSRRRQPFRRKQDDLLPLFPIELGVGKDGFKATSGLISGQKIQFIFRQMTLHTLAVEHFDRLRIPFRAVAADLADGSKVVLADGSLAEAMRASMAVPGVFTPVTRGKRVLVDGGITENLPVAVARAMGGERLIVIDISGSGREFRGDENAIGVLYQAFTIINGRNVEESKRLLTDRDLYIQPELGDLKSTNFDRVADAIERGESATRVHADALSRFSVSESRYQAFLARHRLESSDLDRSIQIDEIKVAGTSRVASEQITSRIELQPGGQLDLSALREDLDRIFQIGEFTNVDFRIEPGQAAQRLVIETEDKPWGPHYLRAGLSLNANLEGDSDFLALVHYRRTQLNRWGAEWQTVVTVGDINSVDSEFFQPIGPQGNWFVRPRLELLENQFLDRSGELDFSGVDVEGATLGLDAGVHLANDAEISLGLEVGTVDVATQSASGFEADLGGLRLGLTLDRLDDPNFPRLGGLVALDLYSSTEELGADDDFQRLAFEALGAWSFGRHTLLGRLQVGAPLGSELPIYDEFELGGFFNLSGFDSGELRGDALGFASLAYYQQRGRFYLGGSLELGNVWAAEDDAAVDDLLASGLVFVGVDSFVGPVYVGYGFAETGRESLYLFLGRVF